MKDLEYFLSINGIDEEKLYDAVHLDIRENLLRIICKKMKADKDLYLKVKKMFFSTSDLSATKKVVKRLCDCQLSEDDLLWMNMCIKAFLDKNNKRAVISEELKKQLLEKQQCRCAICGDMIDRSSVHVDHIIPWDYVGDELKDNYQALCPDCNLHKSNHVAIAVSNIILHKTEASK